MAIRCPILDLREPKRAPLVDTIADALKSHVAQLEDAELRTTLCSGTLFEELYQCARDQQNHKDPTQDIYSAIGPLPAKQFHLKPLMRYVASALERADYVRIDVADYTAEQRAMVRVAVAELTNPRVQVVDDG
jgi:hypothetical protein